MLNRLRKGVKSLTAKILVGLLVASFAVWGIGDIFSFRLDARVASVGETTVSAERFANSLSRQQSQLSRQMGELVTFERMRQSGVARSVLSGLIRDAAFEEELRGLGLSAPDAAVADAIRQHPAFQGPAGQFSTEFYQLSLRQQGMTVTEFERLTRTLLAQELLVETAEAGAVAPPGIAERIATYRGEQRAVNLLTLTAEMAPDPGMPADDALRTFYEENQELFREPERRWGEYLHVDAGRLMAELAPAEAELRTAYEAEKNRYTTQETRTVDQLTFPERSTAEEAVGRLASGDVTFEVLAEEQGLTPDDVALGRVGPGDLPEAAVGLVFGESGPGIVGPVELAAGYALYRVREVTPGGTRPFEEVRDEIAERLGRDALLTRAPEIANRVEELRAAGRSMEEIAAETDAVHGSFDGLARDGTLAGDEEAEGVVARQAFIAEVFAALDAEERDLVETEEGGYFLVMVRRIQPSEVPPLEQVRERAVAAWQARERLAALEQQASDIVARLGEVASIWEISEELGVEARSLPPFTRLSPPDALPAALVDQVFRVESGEGAFAAAEDGEGVVVAQVSSIALPAPERIERESAQIAEALAGSVRNDLGEYFTRAVVERHEPTVDWTVVDEVFSRLGAASQPAR